MNLAVSPISDNLFQEEKINAPKRPNKAVHLTPRSAAALTGKFFGGASDLGR